MSILPPTPLELITYFILVTPEESSTCPLWWHLLENYPGALNLRLAWVSVITTHICGRSKVGKACVRRLHTEHRVVWRNYAVQLSSWGSSCLRFTTAWEIPKYSLQWRTSEKDQYIVKPQTFSFFFFFYFNLNKNVRKELIYLFALSLTNKPGVSRVCPPLQQDLLKCQASPAQILGRALMGRWYF